MRKMYRQALTSLQRWQKNTAHKPLIIRGARQVGKTWLMQEFGHRNFTDVAYINFDNNSQMQALFAGDFSVQRLLQGLEIYCGHKINAANTLIIFDEVQEVPQALASLKYFYENAPQYFIVCAGSLLGLALHAGTSFPVGKVEFLDLGPLSFSEFMTATGNERFVKLLQAGDFTLANTFATTYTELLKQYLYTGGMPEVVAAYCARKDLGEVRRLQQNILTAYEQDFSKHVPLQFVPRVRGLWQSIPGQLARENKKFIYGLVREGARAKEYELALLWLKDCGLIHRVARVSKPQLPLAAYEDNKAFKLYLLDVGLLGCLSGLTASVLLDGSAIFKEFKGALTEQYVLQQLKTLPDLPVFYWTNDRGSAEVDFLLELQGQVVPLEVKAAANLQAKSLKVFAEKFKPQRLLRSAMVDYKKEENLTNLPLWAIECVGWQHV